MIELTAREQNYIISAVNRKDTAEKAGLQSEEELRLYHSLWKQAEEIQNQYGRWPVFELCELDW